MQQHGVVDFIGVGSQENYSWAPPILLFNFLFFLIFPSLLAGSGEPAFLNSFELIFCTTGPTTMQPVKTTWVVAIVACQDQVFRAVEDVAVETNSLLFRFGPHSLCGEHVLSPHGLSLPSNGSLPAISPCWR